MVSRLALLLCVPLAAQSFELPPLSPRVLFEQLGQEQAAKPSRLVEDPPPPVEIPSITVTYSHQPTEVMKAVMLTKLPGVSMFEAVVCNNTAIGTVIPGGRILQVANKRTPTISPKLALVTIDRARKSSKLYKAAKIAEWAGWGASFLTVGGVVAAQTGAKMASLIFTQGANRLTEAFEGKGMNPAVLLGTFIDPEKSYAIPANACQSGLFLGRYKTGLDVWESTL